MQFNIGDKVRFCNEDIVGEITKWSFSTQPRGIFGRRSGQEVIYCDNKDFYFASYVDHVIPELMSQENDSYEIAKKNVISFLEYAEQDRCKFHFFSRIGSIVYDIDTKEICAIVGIFVSKTSKYASYLVRFKNGETKTVFNLDYGRSFCTHVKIKKTNDVCQESI